MLGSYAERRVDKIGSALRGVARPAKTLEPIEWIEANISLANDATSASDANIKLDAWQREPVLSQFDPSCRMVVMVAIEQVGKSTIWRMPLVYKMLHDPAPRWVIYESDDKAEDINRRTFEPLLASIPELSSRLNRTSSTKRSYFLDNGAVTDFSGAGGDITSKPVKDGVADELDRWGGGAKGFAERNLRNFEKRFRTFWRRGEGCLVIACSPKDEPGKRSAVWRVFAEQTSASFWHLRCLGCGSLSMRSCDIHNLQWQKTDDGAPIPDSPRLICPKCGREHTENEAWAMSEAGGYVTTRPEENTRRGYQVGSLGVPRVFRWIDIARAQSLAGSTSDVAAQSDFDNSWRGLPFQKRRGDNKIDKRKVPVPDASAIKYLMMACDTQDDGVYWIVRGIDAKINSYLIAYGEAKNWLELENAWNAVYLGRRCVAGIIDHGGHRPREAAAFVRDKEGFFLYKGNPKIGARQKLSTESRKLILANPNIYKGELLYYIYSAAASDNYQWFLPIDISEKYMEQILDVKPPLKSTRGRDDYENWEGSGNDHYFDCEKEWLVLREFAISKLKTKKQETRKCVRKEDA